MTARSARSDGSGYFLYHSIGMFPDKAAQVAAALTQIATLWGTCDDAQWPASLAIRQQFIDTWCRIINAPRPTMTTAENVTTAVHSLIGALPARHLKGCRLLIAEDCFPSVHFLLSGMAARHGFVLETVRCRPGESWVRDEDVIAHWGADVGVAFLTLVTSTTSHRCDLGALVAHGRRMGSLIGVDITQGVGIVPFDVQDPQVDFVVSTSLKWLCGTAGAGVLYVCGELLRESRPELRGWFSQEDILSWNIDTFEYARDARRFDHGTPSILASAASLPALRWYSSQAPEMLRGGNRELVARIVEEAPGCGLALVSPADPARRGGSIMLRLPAGTSPPAVIDGLRADGVFADCRGNTLRLSPGNLTTQEGVERLCRNLSRALAGKH